jgi:hypothetical protein
MSEENKQGKVVDQIITINGVMALPELGKRIIKRREKDAVDPFLSSDYLEGFRKGVAEFIAALVGAAVADILKQLND